MGYPDGGPMAISPLLLSLLSLLALSMGCGRIGYGPLDGAVMDSATTDSRRRDASPTDSATFDSRPPADTGMSDSGPLDTGAADAAGDGGPPDAGPCVDDPCRLVLPQCGCVAGQMCTRLTPGSATRSCAPSGAAATGEACTFSTHCLPGNSCTQVNGVGVCSLWCEADMHCPATECLRLRVADPVGACRNPCDPVADTGCPAGQTCYAAQGEAIGGAITTFTVCGAAGVGDVSTACTLPFECGPGLVCPAGTCEEVCDTSAPSCSLGSCTNLGWAPVDGQTLGACR